MASMALILAPARRNASARYGFALASSAAALPAAAAASRAARLGNAGGCPVLGTRTSTKRQLVGWAFNAACRPLSTHSSHGVHSGPGHEGHYRVDRGYFEADSKDLESDEALWALYRRWCQHFKFERSHEEMIRRFETFKKRAWYVQGAKDFNKNCGVGLGVLADTEYTHQRPPVTYEQYLQARQNTCSDED